MNFIYISLALLVSTLLIGCSSSQVVRTPATLTAEIPTQKLERLWQLNLGKMDEADGRGLQLSHAADRVFVSSSSGRLSALWKETKTRSQDQVIWQIQFEASIISGPLLHQDQLIIGTSKGDVLALSATSGEVLWQNQLNSEVVSQPVIADSKVFVRTNDGRVVALNLQDGASIWVADHQMPNLFLRGAAPVLVDGETLFVGRESGTVEALTVQNGAKQWDVRVATPSGRTDLERMVDVQAELIIHSGRLFVLGYNGQLVAINPISGNFLWTKELMGYRDMLVDNSTLYVIDEADILHALDAGSGTEYWTQPGLKFRQTSTVMADQTQAGRLIVTDGFGYVHWLNARDGGFISRFKHANHLNKGEKIIHWLQLQDRHYVLDSDGNFTVYQQDSITTRPGDSPVSGNK